MVQRQILNSNKIERWKKLQKLEHLTYLQSIDGFGVMSVDSYDVANMFGDVLRQRLNGLCLDVGCGLLPCPAYMKNQKNIKFIGIDPFEDKVKRKFKFVYGIGEFLPFRDGTFDSVIFSSTIDHMIDPRLSIKEAYRVLKDNGILLIWFTCRKDIHNKKDRFHQWQFNKEILINMVNNCNFTSIEIESLNGKKEHILTAKAQNKRGL